MMTHQADQADTPATPPRGPRLQFSLATLLLSMTAVGLAVALLLTNRRLAEAERRLKAIFPLPVDEVALQFENRTTVGPITTRVRDVRYSSDHDSFLVNYEWTDSQTGQTWSSDLVLESDGFGRYSAVIHNDPFIKPLGNTRGFTVLVESPSALQR